MLSYNHSKTRNNLHRINYRRYSIMAYDYREAVKDDVLEYINNEINFEDFDCSKSISPFESFPNLLSSESLS